jgi:hypothetical protein
MMIRAALVLLLLMTGAACAHQPKPPPVPPPPARTPPTARVNAATPGPTITDFHTTPAIITASVPGFHVDVFAQHPGPGQAQVVAYLGTTLIYNAIVTIRNNVGVFCSVLGASSNVAWALIPAVSPMIGYQLAVQATSTGAPLFFAGPPIVDPGGAAAAGTF